MQAGMPYSLRADSAQSGAYYQVIANYAAQWLEQAAAALQRPVAGFLAHLGQPDPQPAGQQPARAVRSPEEAAFEMLVLGVLLREHGEQALHLAPPAAWLLARLVQAQDRLPLPVVEKPVKAARGLLYGLAACAGEAAADALGDPAERASEWAFGLPPAQVVERLVGWLAAGGATAQAERLDDWRAYLARLDEQAAEAVLARCLLLADEFAETSQAVLGPYTEGQDEYSACLGQPGWRYDAALITRTRVEYHLGMLGTEILTRAYRARYQAMPRKIVVVPDCLCAISERVEHAPGLACQAERTSLGGRCRGCTPTCRVHQITRLGQQRGFEVYILPDDYRGVGLGACSSLQGVGVVGVSCALTNWDAGWQVAGAGVPCQGVLLDYAGCKNHWNSAGRTTDVNLPHLLRTLGLDEPPARPSPTAPTEP